MKKISIVISAIVLLIAIGQSCSGDSGPDSKHGATKSHEFGTSCMSCHIPGGKGKIAYSVAGSVLDEARAKIQKKCVVKLYRLPEAQGELIATIESDANGNFFTTQKIDFTFGLYPTLLGTPGVKEDTKHMRYPIYSGDCNGCHGTTTEKLGID